jgi:CBS domain-containing protein
MIPCVLVATDGMPGALGAIWTAHLLAKRDGSRVEVVAVYDPPMQFYGLGAATVAAGGPSPFGAAAVEALHGRVDRQLASVGVEASQWPLQIRLGSIAPTIVRVAAERGANLILLGLRSHAAMTRWLGRETLLRVIHLAHVPVLAVPPYVRSLPKRAVAAVDMSELSVRAAHLVPELVGPRGELHLAHSTWAPAAGESWATMDWVKTYRSSVEERIEELSCEIQPSAPLDLHVHLREDRDPAREVLRLAQELGADLIAAGSHGHGYFGRLVFGSTSRKLVHGAHCAVLIVPPTDVPSELHVEGGVDMVVATRGARGAIEPADAATVIGGPIPAQTTPVPSNHFARFPSVALGSATGGVLILRHEGKVGDPPNRGRKMQARDLMTPNPQVVTANEPISRAARIMRDQNVGCVPVVDDRSRMRLSGVITDRDIVVRCIAERHFQDCRVGDHMTTDSLDTVRPQADVLEVSRLMERDQVRRILVTEHGRLVGIIAQADLALKEGPLEPLVVEHMLERISAPSLRLH